MHPMKKLLPLVAVPLFALTACGGGGTETTAGGPATADGSTSAAAGACAYTPSGQPSTVELPPADPTVSGEVPATMTIGAGGSDHELGLELDAAAAPCTVNSFVSLADQGYYDGTSCHRLTTQGIFVLQCGDPTGTGTGGPGYTIPDEFRDDMTYGPGTLAMANTGHADSGGSQFFIVYAGEDSQLPPQYTVFGQITEGLEELQGFAEQGTTDGSGDGTPADEVTLESFTFPEA